VSEFIQIMEVRTTKLDEMIELERRWEKATEGKRTLRRQILTRDRNDPTLYRVLAFFDSYESAMENSALPETQLSAAEFDSVADGPITFADLDVVEDRR
jgi:hypothetical protein